MTEWSPRVRRTAGLVLAFVLAAAMDGCGVSTTSVPEDIGDALVQGGASSSEVRTPPSPDTAGSPENLVRLYLRAATGGGDDGIKNAKDFLNENALKSWREPAKPSQLTVIRLLGQPVPGVPIPGRDRTPVTVNYEIVGLLNEQGRIDDLVDLTPKKMVFWVVADKARQTYLRIDEITDAPPGLLVTDDLDYYLVQTIYFWDAAGKALVPDPRYLPLTYPPDRRATTIARWLIEVGPSSWLPGAQKVPPGTVVKGNVVTRDRTFVVNITVPAAPTANAQDLVQRLYYQLQWSLRSGGVTPLIELQIDDQAQAVGPVNDYLPYNQASLLSRATPSKYDIADGGKVLAVPASGPQPDLLKSPDNAGVVAAAVDRSGSVGAFVRTANDNRNYLQIVRGASTKVDSDVPRNRDMGRPVWIPGLDQVLVPSGGRLYVVGLDGRSTEVALTRISNLTQVSVSADGRRVALVAAGQLYVTSLGYDGTSVTVGSNPRQLLAKQVNVTSVAWINEVWLYVLGAGAKPALWRTSADGVQATDVSGDLSQVVPLDIVALPAPGESRTNDVLLTTTQGTYNYNYGGSVPFPEDGVKKPFFVS